MSALFKITHSDKETVFYVVAKDPTAALGKAFDLEFEKREIFKTVGSAEKIEIICDENIYNQTILIP